MDASYFVAVFFNELVQALNSGLLLVIGSEVENLGYGTVFLGLNLNFSAGYLLG